MDAPANAPVLQFDRVSLAFDDQPVLREVSFSVGKAETLVVLGAAASGKTVLLKCALGLLPIDSGRIFLFGRDVSGLEESAWYELRSHIGVLFQEGGLFDSLTIEENVAYPLRNQKVLRCPPEEILRRVERSLQFVELGHTLERYPSELSGGMRRRVGIARAIVTQPDLLLYDSPTAGLDPITATTILTLIVRSRDVRHAAILLVTQRYQDGLLLDRYRWDTETGQLVEAEPLSSSTRYLVLEKGAVVFEGTQEEFEACTDPYVSKFAPR
jgi:phospholipid/cholesterol/gamma-HCH transport system ATP-binding protein